MSLAISVDLRDRVVAAVNSGMTRYAAARHFRVSPASAVRWVKLARSVGNLAPKARGGDRRSHRIEAQAAFIMELYESRPELTLNGILEELVRERRERFSRETLARFFARRGICFKDRRRSAGGRPGPSEA